MPEQTFPGVFVEELPSGPHPIEGVPTSTAAFIGETERGRLSPVLVQSYAEYQRFFGGTFSHGRYMPHSVSGFFENGGRRLFVCRVVGQYATTASKDYGDFIVEAIGPGAWGRRVWVKIQEGSTRNPNGPGGFRLSLAYWSDAHKAVDTFDPFEPANRDRLPRPQQIEEYDDLSVDSADPNFFEKVLTHRVTGLPISSLAMIRRIRGVNTRPPLEPAGGFLSQNGIDDPGPLGADDYAGATSGGRQQAQGLLALEGDPFREVALVHAPRPIANADPINMAVINHCERLQFRFAVIDADAATAPGDLDPHNSLVDTKHAAFYAPWIVALEPGGVARVQVPPGGHVLGVYARVDMERGVFKAPANELIRGALDVAFEVDDRIYDDMAARGVNAIRRFPGGIRVWGARTLSHDSTWKYVPVRRLLIFLERSIVEGMQWVVFEPNDDRLWGRVKDTIRLFLRAQWRAGALAGQKEDEAFRVAADRTTMTEEDVLSGRLIVDIGVAPIRPAEFVVVRIVMRTGEAGSR